jgi:hypothetical protein
MRTSYLFLLLLALPAVAHGQSSPLQLLEGYWFGESYQPRLRETTQELMHHRADGTYEIEFRVYKNCLLTMDQKETGRWSATAQVYHTDTEAVNGRKIDAGNPDYHDDYNIETLGGDGFTYVHTKTGVRTISHRVPSDFIFPACGA